MIIQDPAEVKGIKQARPIIDALQRRLYVCEEKLDDLARAVEIAMVSGQYQLLVSFVQDARVCLEDRLQYPEVSQEDLDRPVTIIEDDRVSAKSA
jgi:hypothetical protein